ncbi:amidohydrolase family protein [Nocardia mexicana]|uniref:Imidazolonepropionase-like amidohydrolase n=1 Tax=Nocardia mexicana TaxID=279262 RepID=A0A370GL19_9NOCA|nr:amidohydrolase family protein [Nocardia mexicana]RDI44468.1 imidazolonepropionase-like amidohydrolase [Nocardia mexicana]
MTSAADVNSKTVLNNVRVFDGHRVGEPVTVVIDGGVIGTDPSGAQIVEAGGAVLLPGFIDAHVHLDGPGQVEQLAVHGVTTALDMAAWPPDMVASLRELRGTADVRSAGLPVIGPGGLHAKVLPAEAVIHGPDEAEAAVAARVASGSDYLKLVLEAPGEGGPEAVTAKAVVTAAHMQRMLVVAHAASPGAYAMALDAGADIVTHIPLGVPLSGHDVGRMVAQRNVAVPTLTMMEGIATATGNGGAFAAALTSTSELHAAGVPILAGTDANDTPNIPFAPEHGASLHHELELLVRAGLSTVEALNAATALPARHFGLADRGVIAPGGRADLVLVEGDPVADIAATRAIRRVWCGGVAQPLPS